MNRTTLPGRAAPASFVAQLSASSRATLERIGALQDATALQHETPLELVRRAAAPSAAHAFARAHAPAAPQPAQNVYVAELERAHRKRERWNESLRRRMARHGFRRGEQQREALRHGWSPEAWIFVRECQYDPTSRRIRNELERIRRRAPAFVGAVVAGALEPLGPGRARRSWTHPRARRCAMLWIAMFKDSVATRRGGTYRRLFRGVTEGSMLALLQEPHRARLHRNTLCGRHRAGAVRGCDVGYLIAAEHAGVFYAQQLPAACVAPSERWIVKRNGAVREVASNRYWLTCAHPADARLRPSARARAAELARMADAIDLEALELVTRHHEARALAALELELANMARPPPD